MREHAIDFAKWLAKNYWQSDALTGWKRIPMYGQNDYKTSEQLYEIFIKQHQPEAQQQPQSELKPAQA